MSKLCIYDLCYSIAAVGAAHGQSLPITVLFWVIEKSAAHNAILIGKYASQKYQR